MIQISTDGLEWDAQGDALGVEVDGFSVDIHRESPSGPYRILAAYRIDADGYPGESVEADQFEIIGWGGARPNTGGARPNSGPLAGTIRGFRPFAWRQKGDTISSAQFEFTRCNLCQQFGWESLRDEMHWDATRPEGEGWQDVEGVPDNPLVHLPGCENQ